jgi:hypothetical protein
LDVNTVYIALDNHKYGDFNPYLLKSSNQGKTWVSIRNNIPDRTIVWRIVQDHEKPELLFLATEFGIWFTLNGGAKWKQFKGGLPVISFRDIAIQRRENDLVAASFGRGFYILDDYTPLRHVSTEQPDREGTLFPVRKAWWYLERDLLGSNQKASQGDAYFTADNPPFGAVFSYYLRETYETKTSERQKAEKALAEQNKDIPFPGWEALEEEIHQDSPKIWIHIQDHQGNFIRGIEGPAKKGFHRISWNLQLPSPLALRQTVSEWEPKMPMVAPGKYTAILMKQVDGVFSELSGPVEFEVEQMRKGVLEGAEPEAVTLFWKEVLEMRRATSAAGMALRKATEKVNLMRRALTLTPAPPREIDSMIQVIRLELIDLDKLLNGSPVKREIGDKRPPTLNDRLSFALYGTAQSTYGPTPSHRQSLQLATQQFASIRDRLDEIRLTKIPAVEKALSEAGSPWIEGQAIPGE